MEEIGKLIESMTFHNDDKSNYVLEWPSKTIFIIIVSGLSQKLRLVAAGCEYLASKQLYH